MSKKQDRYVTHEELNKILTDVQADMKRELDRLDKRIDELDKKFTKRLDLHEDTLRKILLSVEQTALHVQRIDDEMVLLRRG